MSPILPRYGDGMLVATKPCLVVREMLEVDVVEDSILRVNIQIIQIKQTMEVGVFTVRAGPLRFSQLRGSS